MDHYLHLNKQYVKWLDWIYELTQPVAEREELAEFALFAWTIALRSTNALEQEMADATVAAALFAKLDIDGFDGAVNSAKVLFRQACKEKVINFDELWEARVINAIGVPAQEDDPETPLESVICDANTFYGYEDADGDSPNDVLRFYEECYTYTDWGEVLSQEAIDYWRSRAMTHGDLFKIVNNKDDAYLTIRYLEPEPGFGKVVVDQPIYLTFTDRLLSIMANNETRVCFASVSDHIEDIVRRHTGNSQSTPIIHADMIETLDHPEHWNHYTRIYCQFTWLDLINLPDGSCHETFVVAGATIAGSAKFVKDMLEAMPDYDPEQHIVESVIVIDQSLARVTVCKVPPKTINKYWASGLFLRWI